MTLRTASIWALVDVDDVNRRKRRWSGKIHEKVMCVRKKVKYGWLYPIFEVRVWATSVCAAEARTMRTRVKKGNIGGRCEGRKAERLLGTGMLGLGGSGSARCYLSDILSGCFSIFGREEVWNRRVI